MNLRVTAAAPRRALAHVPVASADGAGVGEGEGVFRVDDRLQALPTRYLERPGLVPGEPVPGPAVVFQRDTTILVPPGWTACAEASGNLMLAR